VHILGVDPNQDVDSQVLRDLGVEEGWKVR
jgi:hypothetical protein